mmetsp:Transcript_18970/g.46984  ORF Transcript_18970/g.46984 Transcript_18970/m.46984 type:complete len:255 (-) Transcript_18970:1282-2046(-)
MHSTYHVLRICLITFQVSVTLCTGTVERGTHGYNSIFIGVGGLNVCRVVVPIGSIGFLVFLIVAIRSPILVHILVVGVVFIVVVIVLVTVLISRRAIRVLALVVALLLTSKVVVIIPSIALLFILVFVVSHNVGHAIARKTFLWKLKYICIIKIKAENLGNGHLITNIFCTVLVGENSKCQMVVIVGTVGSNVKHDTLSFVIICVTLVLVCNIFFITVLNCLDVLLLNKGETLERSTAHKVGVAGRRLILDVAM